MNTSNLSETEIIALMLIADQPMLGFQLMAMTENPTAIVDLYLNDYVVTQDALFYLTTKGRAVLAEVLR